VTWYGFPATGDQMLIGRATSAAATRKTLLGTTAALFEIMVSRAERAP
jgi:hypothetical protein